MADEPKKDQPEEIESILSDLDAILSDMGGATPAAPKPEPPKLPAPKPVDIPKPVEAVKAVAPPPSIPIDSPKAPEVFEVFIDPPKATAPIEPPKATEVVIDSPKANQPSIELAPREGIIKPPEKKPEPPKPAPKLPVQRSVELSAGPDIPIVEPPKATAPIEPPKATAPIEPPKPPEPAPKPVAPAAAASPATAPAAVKAGEIAADTPKEQIRRVAYIHTASCAEVKMAFAAFLSQASRTISKKPLFLREVLSHEVSASSDPNAVLQKALQAKAVAILAVVEDWPSAKVDELSDACARANLQFRAVAPADTQKKSTAVDIIVDMMLLPGEG